MSYRLFLFLFCVFFSLFAHAQDIPAFPIQEGKICFEYESGSDSFLSKEVLFKASLAWLKKTFPYGRKNIIVEDQPRGRLMSEESSQFNYRWLMDEYTMKFNYTIEIDVKYGKCRIRLSDVRPFDEVKGSETGNYSRSVWEERSLGIMYEQYKAAVIKPSFMKDKLMGFSFYFENLLASYKEEIKRVSIYLHRKEF